MTIPRIIESTILEGAKLYPVVTIMGPRQAGKSTTARKLFPDKPYTNLEAIDVRTLAMNDPRSFLGQFPEGAIIDEIQLVPELLSYIQVIVDEKKQKGQFILTGSQQLSLNAAITQSLAGRTDIIKLLPLSFEELKGLELESTSEDILTGFYPFIRSHEIAPSRFYRNYFETYVERDVRQLLNVKDLNKFQMFVKFCAGRVGQLLNASDLANSVGVSSHTIEEWLSVLEASFILFRLYPFFGNVSKRLIKSPKIYFYDAGLLSYLLGIETANQLKRDPLYGNIFENLVVTELLKARFNRGKDPGLFFYRDKSQREVDIIFQRGHEIIAMEVKSAQTFHPEFTKNIHYLQSVLGEQLIGKLVVYDGDIETNQNGIDLLNVKHAHKNILQ